MFTYGNGSVHVFGAGLDIELRQSCYNMIRRIKCAYNSGLLGGNFGIEFGDGSVYNNVTIEESIIAYGWSRSKGGGIRFLTGLGYLSPYCNEVNRAEERTTLNLRNTSIFSNIAYYEGGGLAIDLTPSCYNTHVNINNVTLSENLALYVTVI